MHKVVGWYCSYPNSCRIALIYRIVLPALADAVNSASVDESATVAWYFDLYAISPPANICAIPVTDLRWALSLPQSESTYECKSCLWVSVGNFKSRSGSVTGLSGWIMGRCTCGDRLQ